MPDEEVQELGREGVGMVKAWLEATTWFDLPFNAYEDATRCVVPTLGGVNKKFDLRGIHLGDKKQRRGVTVECKRYTTRGRQLKEFKRFLAIAYSFHAFQEKTLKGTWREDFLWVTSNPFLADGWADLCSEDTMAEVITDPANDDLLEKGHVLDEALMRRVLDGVWLLVFHEKQMTVTLTPSELKEVMTVLTREGTTLWAS